MGYMRLGMNEALRSDTCGGVPIQNAQLLFSIPHLILKVTRNDNTWY